MNITELMIGDWVNFCGKHYKVEYVDARGEEPHHRIALRNSEGYFIGHPGPVEPIPITFEILKKNDFVKSFTGYMGIGQWICEDMDDGSITIGYRMPFIEKDGYLSLLQMQYVHELQHALRLCKIEKEIEL